MKCNCKQYTFTPFGFHIRILQQLKGHCWCWPSVLRSSAVWTICYWPVLNDQMPDWPCTWTPMVSSQRFINDGYSTMTFCHHLLTCREDQSPFFIERTEVLNSQSPSRLAVRGSTFALCKEARLFVVIPGSIFGCLHFTSAGVGAGVCLLQDIEFTGVSPKAVAHLAFPSFSFLFFSTHSAFWWALTFTSLGSLKSPDSSLTASTSIALGPW